MDRFHRKAFGESSPYLSAGNTFTAINFLLWPSFHNEQGGVHYRERSLLLPIRAKRLANRCSDIADVIVFQTAVVHLPSTLVLHVSLSQRILFPSTFLLYLT